ncbi:MAG: HEAT repeat domain-containing protein, partial [Planctomycetaceae bacterium]|nr:HEAT repeat domain-containing protein [Planctomycetaceae bacterium]
FALSAFGPHAMEAVPELRAKLADESVAVRARAAYALGQIGPAARRAGEELCRLVSDPDVSVRRNSASALGGIGADTAVARPALRIALGDTDAGVRCCAVTALGLIDVVGSADDLQRALNDSDAGVRHCAAAVLGIGMPTQPECLENALSESRPAQSAAGLKLYSPDQAGTVETVTQNEHTLDATDFIAQLEDADSDVRWRSSQELSRLGASAVPEMIASLNHRNPEVRRLLVHALGRVGGAARSAVPSLLVALHDVNGDVRSAAADCLGHFDVVSRPMVQELMQSLFDPNSEVRRYSATTLGRFGQHAGEATTALQVAAISDIATKVRVAAQAALQRITESLVGAA